MIADLRELDRLTGGPDGARRVCWTPEWQAARDFLRERLGEIEGVTVEEDEAATCGRRCLAGRARRDGRRRVAPGLRAERRLAGRGARRDGRGRGAAERAAEDRPGALSRARGLRRRGGRALRPQPVRQLGCRGHARCGGARGPARRRGPRLREVLAEHGVDLDQSARASAPARASSPTSSCTSSRARCSSARACPVAAVSGTAGVERHRLQFTGQASHAGTTPMPMRRTPGWPRRRPRSPSRTPPAGTAAWAPAAPPPGARHAHRRGRPGRARGRPAPRRGRALAAMLAEIGRRRARRRRARLRRRLARGLAHRADPVRRAPGGRARSRRPARAASSPAARCTTPPRWPPVPVGDDVHPSTGGLSHTKEEDTPEGGLVAGDRRLRTS